jgi:hypothetical protein
MYPTASPSKILKQKVHNPVYKRRIAFATDI